MNSTTSGSSSPQRAGRTSQRLWLGALGAALLVAGLVASLSLTAATAFSIIYIAAMMIIAGLTQIGFAFTAPGWQGKLAWTLGGFIYTLAGLIAFANPLLASAGFSLLIGGLLAIGGVSRIVSGFREHSGSHAWALFSAGLVTAAAGLLVIVAWPGVSLWLLGAILSVDLIFQGLTTIGMAVTPRER
jgi:uncharacterized membrane protein HdeD (DUF308 family)